MKKALYSILLLFLFTSAANAQDVDLKMSGDSAVVAESGQTVTIPIVASTDAPGTYAADIDLPEGWRTIGFGRTVTIGQDDFLNLITVSVPSHAEFGDYTVTFRLTLVDNTLVTDEVSVPVTINRHSEIVVETEEFRDRVLVSDNQIQTTFIVHNKGNSPDVVQLNVQDRAGRSTADVTELHLRPGEIRTVVVTTRLEDWDRESRSRHFLRLEAVSSNDPTARTLAGVSRDVFPTLNEGELAYHEYPAHVFASVGFEDYAGNQSLVYQVGASGSGTFREGGSDGMDFYFRLPDQRDTYSSLIPVYDQYTVNFFGANYIVNLGDQAFISTPLMGHGYADFGAGAGYDFGQVGVYAYGATNRRYRFDAHEFGGRVSYRPNAVWENNISYKYAESEFNVNNGHVGTFENVFTPTENVSTTAEIGLSSSDAGTGYAGRGEVRYTDDQLAASVSGEHYSDEYLTYSRGLTSLRGNARYTFSDEWKIFGNANYLTRDFLQNYTQYQARVGADWRALTVYYQHSNRDRDGLISFERTEDLVGARWRFRFIPINAGASIYSNYAWVRDHNTDETADRFETGINMTYIPTDDVRIYGDVSYENGTRLYGAFDQDATQVYAGVGVSYDVRNDTRVSGRVDYSHYETGLFSQSRDDWRFRSAVRHQLPWDHVVELEGYFRQRSTSYLDSYGIVLNYAAPINIPLHRSHRTGLVEGLIIERESRVGIGNVAVFMGDNAGVASNADGEFFFPNQSPGVYTLSVDQMAIGLDYIVMNDQAIREVEVRPGETTTVVVEAVRAATVNGSVLLEGGSTYDTGVNEDISTRPLANVVIELEGENFLRRRVTDDNGEFRIGSIPPGEYTVSIYEEYLPDHYRPETPEFKLVLEPGQVGNVDFVVKPVKREIQFVASEETSVSVTRPPTTATEALATGDYEEYVVQKGDWLSKLALSYYNDMHEWPLIFDKNSDQIADPDLIFPGQILVIPIKEMPNN